MTQRTKLHAAAFLVVMIVWTYLLVRPNPVPESLLSGLSWFDPAMLHFILAKTLHFCVYTGLAIFGGLLPLSTPARRGLFLGLILHGIATEVAQMYVPSRFGSPRDMLIDACGVSLGAYLLSRLRSPRIPTAA